MSWLKKIFGKVNKEQLTQVLEQIYNDLKLKNSDKDEHWLLANTWLLKYGDWEASMQKGSKLARFIAYRDTFQFSLLDNPKSIRGLVLYLIYKELGDKEVESSAEGFGQIMEEIQQTQEGGKLLDVYKKKNPFTWTEIESEKDESVYGLYGFLKSADYLSKNPEEQEKIIAEIEELEKGKISEKFDQDIKLSKDQIAEIQKAIDKDK